MSTHLTFHAYHSYQIRDEHVAAEVVTIVEVPGCKAAVAAVAELDLKSKFVSRNC